MLQELVSLVSLIVTLIIIYLLYKWIGSFPTTDCGRYGQDEGLPQCPLGSEGYGRVCYKTTWPDNGTSVAHKTSVCGVNYPDCPGTGCTHSVDTIGSQDRGTVCNSTTVTETDGSPWSDSYYGDGWYIQYFGDIAWCQRGGVQDVYCEDIGQESEIGVCAKGDNFEGVCWGPEKCSDNGLYRTEICTCAT